MRFIIVTGLSGAGKSEATKSLEDMGYFCVDNLPVPMVRKFYELTRNSMGDIENVALGIDIRNGEALEEMEGILSFFNATKNKVNYIGGNNWSGAGDRITWKLDVPEDALYNFYLEFLPPEVGVNVEFGLLFDDHTEFAFDGAIQEELCITDMGTDIDWCDAFDYACRYCCNFYNFSLGQT